MLVFQTFIQMEKLKSTNPLLYFEHVIVVTSCANHFDTCLLGNLFQYNYK